MRILKKIAAAILAATLAFTPAVTHINSVDTYAATAISMSSYACTVTDLRTGASKAFGNNNGALILYGPSWDQVGEVVEVVNNFIECTDIKNFDYFFLGKGTDSEIVALANNYNFNSKICVINVADTSKTNSFFDAIYGNYVGWGNSYVPPIAIYVDPNGNVYDVTQGSLSIDKIMSHMSAMGIETNYKSPFFAVDVEGELLYDTVAQILKRVNEARAAVGRDPLTLDKGLMDAAMQRAAECAVYYDHTRPDLSSCSAIFPDYTGSCGENIAVGYRSADAVMDGWINSSGHYKNIVNNNFKSIGIGAFYYNGQYYWAQSFGTCTPHTYTIESNRKETYSVACDSSIVTRITLDKSSFELDAGNTATIGLRFTSAESWSGGKMLNSSFKWTSDSAAATVDANGVITAKKAGTATITGTNKLKDDVKVTLTVKVNGNADPLNGLVRGEDGIWYYYTDDVINTSYKGLVYYNKAWYYVSNGQLDKTYLGLIFFNNTWWYVKNGTIATNYTGLVFYDNDWWYVTKGQLDKTYKGVAVLNGNTWFVKDGKLARTISGIWEQDGNIYWIVNGKVDTSVVDLKYANGKWYYFRAGVVDWNYTDLAYANNAWWYVKNGELDKTFTGLYLFRNQLWYINQGKLDKSYVGNVAYNGHTYSVKAGVGTLVK